MVERPRRLVRTALGEAQEPYWRYRLFLLPRWVELGLAPLYGVSLTQRLGEVDDCSATMPSAAPAPPVWPGRTVLAIERDDDLFWVGVVWRIDWSSDAPNRSLSLKGWASMLQRRLILDGFDFRQWDQLQIARTLIDHAQDRPGGDLRIDLDEEMSGILRDRTYARDKPVWEALQELSRVQRGFEHTLRPYWQRVSQHEEQIRFRYQTGFPQLGRTAQETGWVLEYQEGWPGSEIASYSWPEDASGIANVAHAIGADGLIGEALDEDEWEDYPRLERSWSHTSVSEQSTLEAHAAGYLDAWRRPLEETEVHLHPNQGPLPEVGDYARLRLTSPRHPSPERGVAGLDQVWRVVQRQISAPSRGEPERVTLSMQSPKTAQEQTWD